MQDEEQQEFEKYVKQEFDKMIKDYDRVHDVLWGALEKCIRDCEKNYGEECKHPDKYKNGECK